MDYKEKVIALLNSQELTKEQKEKLEDIFPELRESEDEKIRKEIIEYIKTGTYHKSWIAWLEKQAEHKDTFSQPIEGEFPYTNPSNTLNGEIDNIWKKLSCGNMFSSNKNGFHEIIVHFANWFKNQSNKKWHYSNEKCMDNDALVLFHSNFDNTWNLKNSSIINWNVVGKWALLSDILSAEEKLIMTNSPQLDEQKPAVFSEQKTAWSEEDESMLNFVKVVLNRHKDDALFDKFKTTLNDCLTWFRNIKSRVGCEVNCTTTKEWSEEDKKMYKKVETAIDSYYAPFSRDAEEMSEWFKNLKDRVLPQPQQEWSEEDKKMLQNILECLRHGWKKLPTDILKYESWLKSLRPQSQWKPSDEQMSVIEAVINNRSFQRRHLDSLYEQLKKLREE